MRRSRTTAAAAALTLAAAGLAALPGGSAAAAPPAYTVQTLHFATHDRPGRVDARATSSATCTCRDAPARARPVPAILTTNGFGGSKDDQAGIGEGVRRPRVRGALVLGPRLRRLGLQDHPRRPGLRRQGGAAARQLPRRRRRESASPTPTTPTRSPSTSSATTPSPTTGTATPDDPRVGMIGGSYGGGIQFATARVDPRIDTIVPIITWNDLSYSLDPNNTDQTTGVSTATPGRDQADLGAAVLGRRHRGRARRRRHRPAAPARLPELRELRVHRARHRRHAPGTSPKDQVAKLRHASVANFMANIKVPTLLIQGEKDTLFNLNEAAATYHALKAQGTPGEDDLAVVGALATRRRRRVSSRSRTRTRRRSTRPLASCAGSSTTSRTSRCATGPGLRLLPRLGRLPGHRHPGVRHRVVVPGRDGAGRSTSAVTARWRAASAARGRVAELPHPAGGRSDERRPARRRRQLHRHRPAGQRPARNLRRMARARPLAGPVGRRRAHRALTVQVQAPTASATAGPRPGRSAGAVRQGRRRRPGRHRVADRRGHAHRSASRTSTHRSRSRCRASCTASPAGHSIQITLAGGSVNYRGGLTPTPVTVAGGTGQVLTLPTVG